jgi:translation initiation factor 3 subunit C
LPQVIDPHTTEYVTRLRDEMQLIVLAFRCHGYAERIRDRDELCRAKMRLVDHMYYKVLSSLSMGRYAIGSFSPLAQHEMLM